MKAIPASELAGCDLFDSRKPPAIGTKVMVLEEGMIALYQGRSEGGRFMFKPVYLDVCIHRDDLKKYIGDILTKRRAASGR